MKLVACIIARSASTRLPNKIHRNIHNNLSMIEFLIKRLRLYLPAECIYIATTAELDDDILETIAIKYGLRILRGSSIDPAQRMEQIANIENPDYLLRITGDNPFSSFDLIDTHLSLAINHQLDFVRLVNAPVGVAVDLISRSALLDLRKSMDADKSEYMLLYLLNPDRYRIGRIEYDDTDLSGFSATVDTLEDLHRASYLIKKLSFMFKVKPELITTPMIFNYFLSSGDQTNRFSIDGAATIKLPGGDSMSYAAFKSHLSAQFSRSIASTSIKSDLI